MESWHDKTVSEEVQHVFESLKRSIDKNCAIFLFHLFLNELIIHFRFWNLQQQPISYLGLTRGTTHVEVNDIIIAELRQLWPDFFGCCWSCRWCYQLLWGILGAHEINENGNKSQQNGKRQEGFGACSETCPFALLAVWHDNVILWIGVVLIESVFNLNTHLFLELLVLPVGSLDFFFQLFDVFVVSHNCNFNCVIIIAIGSDKCAVLAGRIVLMESASGASVAYFARCSMSRVGRV